VKRKIDIMTATNAAISAQKPVMGQAPIAIAQNL
jgi:hypothetical protein